MTLNDLKLRLENNPDSIMFEDVIALIDQLYTFTPTAFRNGAQENAANENNGSCKLLGFAKLQGFNQQQTLACFGQHYRDVRADAQGDSHQNIRNFIHTGWDGLSWTNNPLQ